jgi:hypothetical protein
MSADTIVNAAKLAWDILKDGEPSADIQSSTANAVPKVDDWEAIQASAQNSHRFYYHRPFVWPLDDYDHIQFSIILRWDHSGRYRGGGAYIPNLYVNVTDLFVGYAWHADIRLTTHNPTNAGTDTAPVARLPITISGSVHSGLVTEHVEWDFVVLGDGRLEINS